MTAFRIDETRAIGVLEAAQAGQPALQDWLDELVAAMRALLPSAELLVGAMVQRHADHWQVVAGDSAANQIAPLASFGEMLPQIEPGALDAYYRHPRRAYTHGQVRERDPAAREVGDQFLAALGMRDSVSVLSQGGDGVSLVLFGMATRAIILPPPVRLLLARTAAHVEAALRLRVEDASPVAVLNVDGRVTSAEGDCQASETQQRLVSQVKTIEGKRRRGARHQSGVIDGWSALVNGQFGIVEAWDGGRRVYHVHPAPPHVWAERALTEREANVLELTARGMPGKVVAYSLGISEGSVSKSLASAAFKTGTGSRSELVKLAAVALQPREAPLDEAQFSPAERDVLAGLRQGWSNAAIARARGTSERTVAQQVGSLLRKSGRDSRRALVASTPPARDET